MDGTFDVGGHELYIRCTGSGSPTIVYLHGYIFDSSGGGSQNAGEIPGLLEEQHQVCVYDRANVGLSDAVEGPLTGSSSVNDLEALLEAANVEGPYLLVGASFGGLLAYMYAATYPEDVVGMVLLDSNLPGFDEGPFDWATTTEQLDQAAASREASKLEGQESDIPVTLIGLENPEGSFGSGAEQYADLKAEDRRGPAGVPRPDFPRRGPRHRRHAALHGAGSTRAHRQGDRGHSRPRLTRCSPTRAG